MQVAHPQYNQPFEGNHFTDVAHDETEFDTPALRQCFLGISIHSKKGFLGNATFTLQMAFYLTTAPISRQ